MFKERVTGLRVCNAESAELFPHIHVSSDISDESLLAVSRVLLYERASEQHPVRITQTEMKEFQQGYCQNKFIDSIDEVLILCIRDETIFQKYRSDVAESGMLLNKVGMFFSKTAQVEVFNDGENRNTVVLVNTTRIQVLHQILAAFHHYLPWVFREKQLTEKEARLAAALNQEDGCLRFIQVCEEFYSERGIERKITEKKLQDLVKTTIHARVEQLKTRAKSNYEEIKEFEHAIRRYLAANEELNLQIFGLENGGKGEVIEAFATRFLSNSNLELIYIRGGVVRFRAATFIDNFSDEKYDTQINGDTSPIYPDYEVKGDETYDPNMSHDLVRAVFDSIFSTGEYRLRAFGCFDLNIDGNHVSLVRGTDGPRDRRAIPNPHICHYSCAGSFAPLFNEALRNGELDEVLDIAISEVSNINFTDQLPLTSFVRDFFGEFNEYPCIQERKTGTYITPAELMKRKEKELEG